IDGRWLLGRTINGINSKKLESITSRT
ncbi:hypothetical protein, partial [Salmonella enterica]